MWRQFVDPDSLDKTSLGSFEEALSTQCPTHKPLVKGFIEHCRSRTDKWSRAKHSDDMGFLKLEKGHHVEVFESISKLGASWDLLLVKRDSLPDHPGAGRVLDPDWADLDMLRRWKNLCLSSHGEKCANPMKILPVRPAWLIDVEEKCLVPGGVTGDYVALSYMYGPHTWLAVDADTLATLQEPYALDTPAISNRLPPIIRRAMHWTSVIGERYLWSDAICITTTDPSVTREQLRMMGSIYASAVVTIIAADGDSQTGLAGLKGASSPRELHQRVIPFGDDKIIVRNTQIFSMDSGHPYYDRGWTYQEYKMSPRKILFNNRELHWECRCNVWHEEMVINAEVPQYIDPRLGVILSGFPDLVSLAHIITDYNEKELRYDEDALPAIAGLLSVVSRSFTGGFLYGLPEMFFDRALGWNPYWGHINLRRRTPSDRPVETRLSPSGLPSWSWIGWQGLLTIASQEATPVNDRVRDIEETIPITEWYTGYSPSDPPSQRRRIRSTWFENRDSYKDFTQPLPRGWTRHPAPVNKPAPSAPHLYPDGCESFVFKHVSMPDSDEGLDTWYYPFPVTDIQESTPSFTPTQTPYLFCETRGVCLWGHQSGDGNIAKLCNSSGKRIGGLHLHNEQSLSLFPETVAEGELGLPVELVAVYKSVVYSAALPDDEKEPRGGFRGLPLERMERYTVLWIEWREGVAYRLASGKVDAEEWEKLNLKSVSLILG